jgi:predicted enzyme related to lactoylglutathione lyase
MANLVVHFEIYGSEPQRLVDFYSGLLGWKFTQFGDMPYWSIDTGEGAIDNAGTPGMGINGGLAQREGPPPEPGAPVNGCNVVVGVDDVDDVFARGLQLGGSQAMAPDDMAGVGRIGYLLDPDGNLLGLISEVLSDGTNVMEQGGMQPSA